MSTRHIFGFDMEDLTILQTPEDYSFLDYVLSKHKTLNRVVELGTFRGLTALYVSTCMRFRGGDVVTFDLPKAGQLDSRVEAMWPSNVKWIEIDVLNLVEQVAAYITQRTLLICDNGDKPREALLYAPYIQGDAVMIVHDAGGEWPIEEMIVNMEKAGLQEIHSAEGIKSRYMVFKR